MSTWVGGETIAAHLRVVDTLGDAADADTIERKTTTELPSSFSGTPHRLRGLTHGYAPAGLDVRPGWRGRQCNDVGRTLPLGGTPGNEPSSAALRATSSDLVCRFCAGRRRARASTGCSRESSAAVRRFAPRRLAGGVARHVRHQRSGAGHGDGRRSQAIRRVPAAARRRAASPTCRKPWSIGVATKRAESSRARWRRYAGREFDGSDRVAVDVAIREGAGPLREPRCSGLQAEERGMMIVRVESA